MHSSNLGLECDFTTGFCRSSNLSAKIEGFADTFFKFRLGMFFYNRFLQILEFERQNWKDLKIHSSNLGLECYFTTVFCSPRVWEPGFPD